jgi:hypothetical protein
MFISPMGEPFRPHDRGEDMLAAWFNQADRNHDQTLTANEMQADADRFFALVDTNTDGEIDPDEITHYEQVIAPEVQSGSHFSLTADVDAPADRADHRGRHRHRWGGGGADAARYQGAERFALLDLSEPVAAADLDFSRDISLQEFRHAALQRFQALDIDMEHQGRLTLGELQDMRPAPPAQPKKPDDSSASSQTPGG